MPHPPDSRPTVTVLVCCYNQEAFVEQAVLSVLAQRADAPIEVIVHDDASTDGTADVLRRLERQHPGRFRLMLRSVNQVSQGVVVQNELALAVDSTYLAYCDGDDYWTDDRKIARQVQFMEAEPWCSISHHRVEIVNSNGSTSYEDLVRTLETAPWRHSPHLPGTAIAEGNFLLTSSVMIRRISLRDEVLRACFDVRPDDFVLYALACENGDIGFLPESMAAYRLHPTNSWATLSEADRASASLSAFWFLSAHLRGPLQTAVQNRLVELLLEEPAESQLPALASVLDEASAERELRRQLSSQLDGLRRSKSWRYTAPMRMLRSRLGDLA